MSDRNQGEALRVDEGRRIMDWWVTGRLIGAVTADDASEASRALLRRDLERMADDLAGPSPTAAERALADAAALAWAALRLYEAQEAHLFNEPGEMSVALREFYQRRLHRAHARYLSTLRALELVRKLAGPGASLRVERTVNVHVPPREPEPRSPDAPGLLAARGVI